MCLFVPCGYGGEDIRQISVRLNPVQFACFNQRRDDGPVFCAFLVASEERIFSVKRNGSYGAFDGIVVDLDATIAQKPDQSVPMLGNILKSLTGGCFAGDLCACVIEP